MKQALESSGTEDERECGFAPHDFDGGVDLFDSGKHIGNKVHVSKCCGIARFCQFVIGGAINIMKDREWQFAPSKLAKIFHIVAIFKRSDRVRDRVFMLHLQFVHSSACVKPRL